MSSYIRNELFLFVQSAWMGAVFVLCYDVLRALRKVLPHTPAAMAVEDLLYWMTAAFLTFSRLFQINQGKIRFFIVTGMLLGACLVGGRVSKGIVGILSRVLEIPVFVVKKMIKWLLFVCKRGRIYLYNFVRVSGERNKKGFWRKKRGRHFGKNDK